MKVLYPSNPYINSYSKNQTAGTSTGNKSNVLNFKDIQNKINGTENKTNSADSLSTTTQLFSTDNLISSSERNFFKGLFPDRADQIDKHVLFNRNGKVTQNFTSKGLIVDGKI